MSKSEARRQKQLAKKKSKRVEKRITLARRNSDNPVIRLAAAAAWPIVETLVPDTLLSQGIGQLLITRRAPDGRLVFAIFLVDVYCLGVKNAYWDFTSEWEYDKLKQKLGEVGELHAVTPEYFAKLIYGAVDYAQAMSIPPHADYGPARMLLAGIDASLCTEAIAYGNEGKPLFINGPHDSPEKIKVIMQKVQMAGGDFLLQVDENGWPGKELGLEIAKEGEPRWIESAAG
jgi:hypothetical protein